MTYSKRELPITPLMTTSEVAKVLRLDPSTVRDMAAEGTIRAYKVGTHWRFTTRDLSAYLEGVASC